MILFIQAFTQIREFYLKNQLKENTYSIQRLITT